MTTGDSVQGGLCILDKVGQPARLTCCADYKLVGEVTRDSAGVSVSSAGDVDGDGLDDVLVGADGDTTGEATGAAYVILGSSLHPQHD